MLGLLKKVIGSAQDRRVKRYRKTVQEINAIEETLQSLTDEQVKAKTDEFRKRLADGEEIDALLPEAYAVVKNACRRMCGTEVHVSGYNQRWDMVPYDVQLIGAIAMHDGTIAEMMTGEGKTLTATLPLYLNALTGKPVHLVTVNDYLAQRDCEWTGSILRWLGLTTGPLTGAVPPHKRPETYQCDVVYGTASEFGFDYLRDNSMVFRKEDQVQNGYYFAIVDEIDSILIDEARTPLIISGPVPESYQMYDELKGGVSELVKTQRDLCNRLATEARKTLEMLGLLTETEELPKLSKEQEAEQKQAIHKLWLTSKGMPRHKVLKRLQENPDIRHLIDQVDLYYHNDQNKKEKTEALSELYIVVDERSSEYELTDKGIGAWEKIGGSSDDFTMIDLGHEYAQIDEDDSLSDEEKLNKKVTAREEDGRRKERTHNIRQLLRAHILMERDVDYMVHEDKIVIIDENTGRPQPGRRFSDGLHQAIEAKEAVSIQKETQTYATITLQNYFRMYDKLAGMTGTALTEAGEFAEIYKLEVLEIPTHRPCNRKDHDDQIYMSEREKYNAILNEVRKIHGEGRPILIGTESLDISEKLSRVFKQNNLPHTVLNAKYHEREAEIIAQAGQKGAITIATNMAGRGTDIKLGAGVAELGGLHVIGASRHQSRRIDRQLRGRCARLGDPGTSCFYISFEDQLMRLFASPRINAMLKRLRPPEGEPITAGILNRSIETAQKRVEGRNYMIRKQTLEYDDVMNKQRQEIYTFRNDVLHTTNMGSIAEEVLGSVCEHTAAEHFVSRTSRWDPEGYSQWLMTQYPITVKLEEFDDDYIDLEQIVDRAITRVLNAFQQKIAVERARTGGDQNEEAIHVTEEAMRGLMIRALDKLWIEHLLEMDHLRSDVGMRSIGQKDPLIEFKQEAFHLFDAFTHNLRTKISSDLFRFQIVPYRREEVDQMLNKMQLETNRSLVNNGEPSPVKEALNKPEPVSTGPRIGRNDLCPCGSGKKYKKCCEVTV